MCTVCDSTNINTIIEFVPLVSGDGFNGGSDSYLQFRDTHTHPVFWNCACHFQMELLDGDCFPNLVRNCRWTIVPRQSFWITLYNIFLIFFYDPVRVTQLLLVQSSVRCSYFIYFVSRCQNVWTARQHKDGHGSTKRYFCNAAWCIFWCSYWTTHHGLVTSFCKPSAVRHETLSTGWIKIFIYRVF